MASSEQLTRQRSQREVENLMGQFNELDSEGHGVLGLAELGKFISVVFKLDAPDEDIKMMLGELPLETSNHVNRSEFPLFVSKCKTYVRFRLATEGGGGGGGGGEGSSSAHTSRPARQRPKRHSTMRPGHNGGGGGKKQKSRLAPKTRPEEEEEAKGKKEKSPSPTSTPAEKTPSPPSSPPPPAVSPVTVVSVAEAPADEVEKTAAAVEAAAEADAKKTAAAGSSVAATDAPSPPSSPPPSPPKESPPSPPSPAPPAANPKEEEVVPPTSSPPLPEVPQQEGDESSEEESDKDEEDADVPPPSTTPPQPPAQEPRPKQHPPPRESSGGFVAPPPELPAPPVPPLPIPGSSSSPAVSSPLAQTSFTLGKGEHKDHETRHRSRSDSSKRKSRKGKALVWDSSMGEEDVQQQQQQQHHHHQQQSHQSSGSSHSSKHSSSRHSKHSSSSGGTTAKGDAVDIPPPSTPPPPPPPSTGAEGLDFFLQLSSMLASPKQDAELSASEADYYEARFQSEEMLQDPLCKIPKDDVEVARFHRPLALTRGPRPTVEVPPDPYVALIFDTLYSDFPVYRRNYLNRSYKFPAEGIPADAHQDEYEEHKHSSHKLVQLFSPAEGSSQGSDPLHPEWIKPQTADADTANAKARSVGRESLFAHYRFDQRAVPAEVEMVNRSLPDAPSAAPLGNRVLLSVDYMYFALGDFEPFFGSIALYDATTRTKLSETFYFDTNTTPMKQLLGADPAPSPTRALFTLPHERALQGMNIWVVLIVEKVLSGDLESARDPYLRAEATATGEPTKDCVKAQKVVQERIGEVCRRHGTHRQFFCCSAFELVQEDGTMNLDNPKLEFEATKSGRGGPFLRARIEDTNDVFAMIAELKEALRKGKRIDSKKTIPGQWRAHVYSASARPLDGVIVDSMRRPVSCAPQAMPFDKLWDRSAAEQPMPEIPTGAKAREIIGEMVTFSPTPEPVVCRAFFNNMFIYPETLNLSREKKKMNLCVTVYLRDDDTPLSEAKEHCLQCFVGRTGLAQSQTSAVIFHTKSATFIDEMKVNLPFPLTPAHHLLFIFRNVHVDSEDDASGQQQHHQQQQHEQVWHATMPLVTAMGNCIESMSYSLMVAPGMPVNRYRSVHDTSGTESQRLQMFRVRVFISSTVYPQDKAVVSFLQTALNSKLPAMAVLDSLKTITAIKREVGVQFFIPLMRSLCICACSETSTEVSMLSIKAIFAFLSNISQVLPGQGPRYPLLQEYVTYDHDNLKGIASAPTSKDVFEGLASAFANFLGMLSKTADDDSGSFSYEPIFGFSWFVLDMISKSLTLAVADAGHLGDPRRHTWLSKEERWEEFARNLKKIATNLGKHIATSVRRADCKMSPDANTSFALFLRDLLAVFHRGRVMEAAKIYLDQLHAGIRSAGDGGSDEHSKESSTISLMITDFLLILADYEHFVPLSMPTVDRVTSLDGLCDKLLKRHMLSGFIVREVFRLLGSKSQDMRLSALQLLIDLLGRLEFDERYQAPASKARIAGMFFPLILLMIDDWRHTKEWQERADVFEEQALYLIFTHILKNIDRDFLTQWWSVEVLSRLTIFLTYIGNSVRAFKWKPGSASEAPAKSFAEARRRLVRDFLAFCNLSADMPLLPSDSPSPSLPSTGTGTLRGRSALKEAAAAATGAQARHLGTGSVRMVRMLNSRTVSMMAFVNPNVMQQESASGGRPSTLQAPSPTLPQSQQQQQQPQQAAMPSVAMSLRPRSTSLAGPPSLSVIEFHGRALCTETSLVHLDIMELLTATFHSELLNKENILISKVFSVMILFLQTSQSARFYGHYFASQRSFITKYRSLLFTTDNPFIGDLCDELVRMCNFSNDTIRSFATAALYIVAKSNYKEMMNIDRTKIHVTTALAKLSLQNTRMFERSLATMALYAAHDFEHSLSGSPSSSRGHHSASTSASSSRLRKVALATAAMSTMVEEAESKRRQATSEKLIQEVEQANVMQVVEFRAQVLEDWCSSKLLLLDAIKAETESFPARLEVIVDLDASISAYEQELDSIVSKLAEAESPPKSAVAKVTRLQQKWAALKKSSSPLVVALQEEKPRREEAAVAAESYATQVSEMFAWFVTTAQSLMCTERCISSSSQADQLSALTAAAAQIEEAFATKLGELKKAEAAMQEVERLAPELTATTSKDIEAAFAAVTKLIDTHRSEVAKDVDAHEQKKALFTKYRAAKDKLGAMLKGQLGTALADGTQSLETFTAEANRAAEEAIMLHKAYERASASIEKRWQHVRAVLECASELTARVSELSGRDAAKRKAAAEHAGAEQQEAVFAREFGEVCKWITQIIQYCTAPLLVTTEEAATALLDENLRMQEDVKAKQGQKERLEGASAEIAKMLKRKPFAASTTRELQDMWQRATELLHDRRLSIQAEISKQRLHEDMRREFADKIAGLDRWIEELLKDTPENALKADPDLTADMQQIRDQRASLAEAKVADILRFSKISVEQVEEKFRNIKAIIQRKQQEIEAAAPSPAPGEGTPPGSPTAARRGGSTSGQTAASIAAAAAAAFGAPPSAAAPPGSSSPGLLQVPTGRPGGAMTDKDRQRMFMRMRPSMKDSFMVFDTTRRSKFAQSIQDLSAHLTKIIHDSQKLNRLKMEELDSELLRELQYEISLGYTDTPDLHITWLLQLASAHLVEKNLVEAAQCKLRVAKIIFDNIRDKLPVQVPIEELQAVYPSLLSRPDEPRSETRILSPVFSERGFIDMLRSSITLFEGSEHFEFCVAIYNLIAPLLLVHHSNVELSGHYKAVSKLFQDIASKDSARMLANYYRVGFYGASFDELNGVEFIYRMGAEVHLFELAQTLKTKYSKKAEVEILDSTRGTSELDPSKRYVQVTAVKPYLTAEEAAARTTFFEKHTLVQRFYLETPFTKNASKAHAMEAKDQWKRRVILTAADTFPSILKRLRVMARETVELTPIQNAIESICRRTADMRAEISNVTDKGAVNLAALQLILQGSVLLQVNSGVLEFCQGFLSPEGRREWPEQVPVLCDVLNEFVGVCRRALDVNKELVKPDQVAFHEQLEQGYIDLEKKVSAYIAGASAPLPPPPPVDILQSPSASSSSSSSQQV